MQITCPYCGNTKHFLIPEWNKLTFRFDEQGEITVMHVRPTEALEHRLASEYMSGMTCTECGSDAAIDYHTYDNISEEQSQLMALKGME